jgi:hypothetical protein
MRGALSGLLLIGAIVLATVGFGWWAVPLAGAAWGAWRSAKGSPVVEAASAAAAAWGMLLAVKGATGPLGGLSGLLGEMFGLPGIALILVTLVFAALLAGSAAGLTASLVALSSRIRLAEDGVD